MSFISYASLAAHREVKISQPNFLSKLCSEAELSIDQGGRLTEDVPQRLSPRTIWEDFRSDWQGWGIIRWVRPLRKFNWLA